MTDVRHRTWAAWATLGTITLSACTGLIDGIAGPDERNGSSATDARGRSAGAGGNADPNGQDVPEIGVGEAPLRRLTSRQYLNTLRDLLGVETSRDKAISQDAIDDSGFIGVLPAVSTLEAQHYLENSETFALGVDPTTLVDACDPGQATEKVCAERLLRKLGRRAYRRPLEDSELTDLTALFEEARSKLGHDYRGALSVVVTAMLNSPFFLYRDERVAAPTSDGELELLDDHTIAARLSYLLWGTLPDAQLDAEADAGRLRTPQQVSAEATRMLEDPERVSDTMFDFFGQLLFFKDPSDVAVRLQKDVDAFPGFKAETRTAMEGSFRALLRATMFEGEGRLSSLLTDNAMYLNQALAPLVGAQATGNDFERVEVNASQRAGILTQPLVLAALSSDVGPLPPRLGNTLWTRVLCGEMGSVPANVPPVKPPAEGLTTRERFSEHSNSPCASCHKVLDPLGFAFLHYDALGGYQTHEQGKAIDASGELTLPVSNTTIRFDDAVGLMRELSKQEDVGVCLSKQWFRYALGRSEVEAERGTQQTIEDEFRDSGFDLRALVRAVVTSKSFMYR